MRDGAEGRADSCRKMRNVLANNATQKRGTTPMANKENLTSRASHFSEPPNYFGCLVGCDGGGGDGACCECEPRVLLRVGVAALDHGIACEMKYIVLEAAVVKYHSRKMFCIDSNIIRGQG